jgi:excisionase family DNA binding protein
LLYIEGTDGELREPLLSVRQAAELLGLCTATVYEHCAKGNLRRVKVASAIRIASSALEEFMELRSPPRVRDVPRMPALPPASSPSAPDTAREPASGSPSNEEPQPRVPDDAWWLDPPG